MKKEGTEKCNVLWISPYAPYDRVGHGGGQNHNYYIKYFNSLKKYKITLLTVCQPDEFEKIDLEKYNISYNVTIYDEKGKFNKVSKIINFFWFHRYGGLMDIQRHRIIYRLIKEYCKKNCQPDIIIMHWAEITLMIDLLKKFFPKSKYIAIEEDVAFQGYERKYLAANGLYKLYKKAKYKTLKKNELKSLRLSDLVVVLNGKDQELLICSGIDSKSIYLSCLYHGFLENTIYNPTVNDLLFYGAMNRIENHKSVLWFLQNVWPLLKNEYRLIIIGANPRKDLLEYKSDRIIIKGFVEDVQPYFEHSLCLISPLVLGAGIKTKILEALSAGTPVITNSIGAEGIGLTDRLNYLHCESAQEYVNAIEELRNNELLRNQLSNNGKRHVLKNFNIKKALKGLDERIDMLHDETVLQDS